MFQIQVGAIILSVMAHGVFIHRADSIYDDIPSERYRFPKRYLARAEACVGDWIVYYEPRKVRDTRGYFAAAKVQGIVPDSRLDGMFLAEIEAGSYLDFGALVPFRGPDGIVERGLLNADGKLSGRAQAAVRPLSREDFGRIVGLGLWGDRERFPLAGDGLPTPGFEEPSAPFLDAADRVHTALLGSRALRDCNFRRAVLDAYGERCAATGLQLINGGGLAEVDAAHIRPVEASGPDLLSNGIALSKTVHWMFDRGLIGVSDDYEILVSRQVNDPGSVHALLRPERRLIPPRRASDRPHPCFLQWHRAHRFKA